MKVPLSWLKQYVPLSLSEGALAETLTEAGLEVEAVDSTALRFTGVVVAKVLSTAAHPNADRLCVATVFDGTETFQVVCGAPNCRAGLVTAFAKIGAELFDENNKSFKIKKSKLRDVESCGMLCSAEELGLAAAEDGIMELSEDLPLGTDLHSLLADTIIDISLTPNLGHCMSIYGIARELSALLKTPLKKLTCQVEEDPSTSIASLLSVELLDKTNCSHYRCRMVKEIRVGPSPDWLKKKLETAGIRSINNVVDIANYVMLECGQPLHIFDYDKIHQKVLRIASHTSASEIVTLDNQTRAIPSDSLLICDGTHPIAFAGIMGSFDSAVSENTTQVVIESALFSPRSIRKTCKQLGLKTDASQRFEKGIDPLMLSYALDRAAELLCSVAGGKAIQGILDLNAAPYTPKRISLRIERVQKLLGFDISQREVVEILDRLQMKIPKEEQGLFDVVIPSYRNDISEEIDLIEEVARIYGFNNIPKTAPLHVSSTIVHAPMYCLENKARESLLREGLQEFCTCDLISPSLAEFAREAGLKHSSYISVLQSKSLDYSILRTSLLPGLVQVVKYNTLHQNESIQGFEIGKIHWREKEAFKENCCCGIILSGNITPYHHNPKIRDIDFFDLKGAVENFLSSLAVKGYLFETSHLHHLHPGRQARILCQGKTIGVLGEIHPSLLHRLDIKQRVFFAEVNLQETAPLIEKEVRVKDLALYPSSERDWTLTLKKDVPIAHILDAIHREKGNLLEQVFVLDLYQSEKLGIDRKNLTLRFTYRDKSKTLAYETVEQEHSQLTQNVAKKLQDCLL